jgi:rare lipoprotein A
LIQSTLFGRSVFIAGLFLALACANPSHAAETTIPLSTAKMTAAPGRIQVGDASWYGTHHEGHRTASGELYDPQLLTAAHPSLPLHSTVRVTNLNNGRSVDVRVNDRGPYKGRRVIDLSAKAAETIGLKRLGVARVKLEPLPRPQKVVYRPSGN